MLRVRSVLCVGLASLVTAASVVLTPLAGAEASPVAPAVNPSCSSFDDPVYQLVKPSNDASILTPWTKEAAGAGAYGFTDKRGAVFSASKTPRPGLVPINRLYRGVFNDFLFTKDSAEVASAGKIFGYKDQGVSFYASPSKAPCLVPVLRYRRGTKHRVAVSAADQAALLKAGWKYEGVAFYAAAPSIAGPAPAPPKSTPTPAPSPTSTPTLKPAPAPAPTTAPPTTGSSFTFAVMPDTQMEVTNPGDPRFANRTSWLVKQKPAFVTQTGDLLNWDTTEHAQAKVAKSGMDVLERAGIPYSIAIGNHDTEATGVGGSARDAAHTRQLQRETQTINTYFTSSDFGDVGGVYEKGKIDNSYSLYTAGGVKWMMLTLEFCARPGAVTWAKSVVAAHPDYNVIVSTHSYENGSGGIDQSNQGYGDTSGQQLFNQLISQYPNIKMVFSGHVGLAEKARVDTGVKGNKIYSFLTTMHDPKTNPVRMLDVDVKTGTIKTWIYAPYTGYTWTQYSETITGLSFVK